MLAEVWQKGLHRIASVFVEDDQGRMLLQRRGPNVKVYPNCWDQAAEVMLTKVLHTNKRQPMNLRKL